MPLHITSQPLAAEWKTALYLERAAAPFKTNWIFQILWIREKRWPHYLDECSFSQTILTALIVNLPAFASVSAQQHFNCFRVDLTWSVILFTKISRERKDLWICPRVSQSILVSTHNLYYSTPKSHRIERTAITAELIV